MKKIVLILLLLVPGIKSNAQDILKTVGDQLIKKDKIFAGRFPINTVNGKWIFDKKPNWFAGFTSGELWDMYDLTGNDEFKIRALAHADNLIKYSSMDDTHDMGFIFFNSCVKAFQHTGEKKYRSQFDCYEHSRSDGGDCCIGDAWIHA